MAWELFLSGLIVGWLVEFALDFFFWRPRRVCSEAEQELQEAVVLLEHEVLRLRRQREAPESQENEEEEESRRDDLKKIWGIGPKVETLLWLHGITTFAQLSATTGEALHQILGNAGERFRISRENLVESWQEQAELAAADRWPELEMYQKKISSNRRRRMTSRAR